MEKSQEKAILEYLQAGHVLTPLDALNRFGCFRLGARIYNLKRRGWNIITGTEITTLDGKVKKFACYRLRKEEDLC